MSHIVRRLASFGQRRRPGRLDEAVLSQHVFLCRLRLGHGRTGHSFIVSPSRRGRLESLELIRIQRAFRSIELRVVVLYIACVAVSQREIVQTGHR